jgi:hypothetical protein
MTRTLTTRHTAGMIAAALALGIAAPAGARPFDLNSVGSFVPAASSQRPAQSVTVTPSPAGGGDISGLGYLAIGTGGAAVALIGIGGTRAASRRRRQQPSATRRSTTVA